MWLLTKEINGRVIQEARCDHGDKVPKRHLWDLSIHFQGNLRTQLSEPQSGSALPPQPWLTWAQLWLRTILGSMWEVGLGGIHVHLTADTEWWSRGPMMTFTTAESLPWPMDLWQWKNSSLGRQCAGDTILWELLGGLSPAKPTCRPRSHRKGFWHFRM